MPVCFGISFTKTLMNQARALVMCIRIGKCLCDHGGGEMGRASIPR